MKLISLFFVTCLCFFSSDVRADINDVKADTSSVSADSVDDAPAFSQVAPSSIMTIDSFKTFKNRTKIVLSNGTKWIYKGNDLFDGPTGWQLGDRINIASVYTEGYYLQNASCEGTAPVKLINSHAEDLKVRHIQDIIANNEEKTNTIILDDETELFIGSWSSAWMKDWLVGDRIIISSQEFVFGKANHLLINLDRKTSRNPNNVRAQLLSFIATSIHEDLNKRYPRLYSFSITNTFQGNDTLTIKLDNNTVWECSLAEMPWQIGDEIGFYTHFKNVTARNLSKETSEEVKAALTNSGSAEINLPVIEKVSKWGKKIVLSDGSVWFSARSRFKEWQKGNRVMVAPLGYLAIDTSTHTLINVDASNTDDESTNFNKATLVH